MGANWLRVRPVEEADLPRIRAIVNHFIATSAFNFRTEPQTVDDWHADWRRLGETHPWLAAVDGGRVVGVAYAAPWNYRTAYRWTVETSVYVDADTQQRGVGDALYANLLGRLRRQGFVSAVAVIALPNLPSVRLHERHGFTPVGMLRNAGFKLGSWHDVGFWQCVLADPGTEPAQPPWPVEL
ncbi:GNAT family N-acetyltransferase [Microlunatus ginsengisoli]|uniref:GNAT family N-acetyltransferase n=1 Tax=Microlunatus ginsengisoli TaxID=363863 RepID=A0ABP7ACV4_9ACTN